LVLFFKKELLEARVGRVPRHNGQNPAAFGRIENKMRRVRTIQEWERGAERTGADSAAPSREIPRGSGGRWRRLRCDASADIVSTEACALGLGGLPKRNPPYGLRTS
jgi:hypothetical protein